jgi:hypothetical protein
MNSTDIAVTVRRVAKCATIWPASGSETTEPAAIASRTRPRWARLRPRPSRTCGMRAAQLEPAKPSMMKAA